MKNGEGLNASPVQHNYDLYTTGCNSLFAQAGYRSSLLTHMSCKIMLKSIESAMASKGMKRTYYSAGSTVNFGMLSVSERQRSESLWAFIRLYWQPTSKRAIEQWWPTVRQKCLYLHHQGKFQHNYFEFVSLHHSDHDGAVRIFVGHSKVVKRLLHKLFTWHNFSPTRSVMNCMICLKVNKLVQIYLP